MKKPSYSVLYLGPKKKRSYVFFWGVFGFRVSGFRVQGPKNETLGFRAPFWGFRVEGFE